MGNTSIYPFQTLTAYLRNKGIITPAPTEEMPISQQLSPSAVNDPLLTKDQTNLQNQSAPQVYQPNAIDRIRRIFSQVPTRDQYEPSTGRRIGAGIAGFFTGLGNAKAGMDVAREIHDKPYTDAYNDWYNKATAAGKEAGIEQSQEKMDTAALRADTYKTLNEAKGSELASKSNLDEARANDFRNKLNELNLKLENARDIANAGNATREMLQKAHDETQKVLQEMKDLVTEHHIQAQKDIAAQGNQTKKDIVDTQEGGKTARHNTPQARIPTPMKPQDIENSNKAVENEMFRTAQPQDQALFEPMVVKQDPYGNQTKVYRLKSADKVPPQLIPAWRRLIQQRDSQVGNKGSASKYTIEEVQ